MLRLKTECIYRILTLSHKVWESLRKSDKVWQSLTKFHKVSQSLTKFHKVSQSFTMSLPGEEAVSSLHYFIYWICSSLIHVNFISLSILSLCSLMNAKLCDDARWQVLTCADMCWQVLMVVDGRWRTLSSADTNWECFKITGMYLSGGCDVRWMPQENYCGAVLGFALCVWALTRDRCWSRDDRWRVLTRADRR